MFCLGSCSCTRSVGRNWYLMSGFLSLNLKRGKGEKNPSSPIPSFQTNQQEKWMFVFPVWPKTLKQSFLLPKPPENSSTHITKSGMAVWDHRMEVVLVVVGIFINVIVSCQSSQHCVPVVPNSESWGFWGRPKICITFPSVGMCLSRNKFCSCLTALLQCLSHRPTEEIHFLPFFPFSSSIGGAVKRDVGSDREIASYSSSLDAKDARGTKSI